MIGDIAYGRGREKPFTLALPVHTLVITALGIHVLEAVVASR